MGVLEALKTDLARGLDARGLAEGVMVGDWSFQVGTGGFGPALEATTIDPTMQSLISPVGGTRQLGYVLFSGGGASLAAGGTSGLWVVSGLAVSGSLVGRWLRLSGSANPSVNGLWLISEAIDATSVVISNPLLTTADTGLAWEVRESCCLRPNGRSASFYCRLAAPDASVDGQELGEVGIFGRVLRSPSDTGLLGQTVLWAVAHHPAIIKDSEQALTHHVVVQG
jgi:hypothetical protein